MKTEIKDNANKVTITLDGDTGDITVGGNAQDGDLIVTNTTGTERVRLDGQTGSITARSAAMVEVFGVNGDTGDLVLRGVNPPGQGSVRIVLNPSNANISAGGNGQGGDLILSDSDGFFRFGLNANSGKLIIRDAPAAGPLGKIRIELSGASVASNSKTVPARTGFVLTEPMQMHGWGVMARMVTWCSSLPEEIIQLRRKLLSIWMEPMATSASVALVYMVIWRSSGLMLPKRIPVTLIKPLSI